MARPRLARLAGALALLALLVAPALPGATGSRVLAHAQLVASSPGAGEVVADAPAELRLAFSEPLEAQVTSLDLRTAGGEPILDRAGSIDPEDPFTLVAKLPALADGAYAVTWRTLSAADGHTVEGSFSFAVGDVELTADDPAATHTETDPVDVAGRFVSYVGLLGALGLAVFASAVVRGPSTSPTFARLLAVGLAMAGVAALVVGVLNALDAGGLGPYLFGSRNGMLQLARGVVTLVGAGLLLAVPGRGTAISGITALVGIGLLVTAGHSAALPGPVPILVGIVHVAGAGVWLGGVAGLALLTVRPGWLTDTAAPAWRSIVPRFSALALVAIGLVGASGVVSAWWQTGTLVSPDTDYGRALLVKTALAVGALALGGLNFLDGGRLRAWLGGLPIRVLAETGIGLAVLLATGVLATTSPIDATPGVAIRPVPDAFGEIAAPDMTLELVPGRPGVNRAVVTTTDALAMSGIGLELVLDRLDGGSTTRVELHHAGMAGMEGMENMEGHAAPVVSGDGTVAWSADAIVLAAGSRWDANVLTLSSAGTELGRQRYAFALTDASVGEGRESELLTPPSVIAGLLLLGGALAIGLGLGGWTLPRTDAGASRLALSGGGVVAVVTGLAVGIDALLRL